MPPSLIPKRGSRVDPLVSALQQPVKPVVGRPDCSGLHSRAEFWSCNSPCQVLFLCMPCNQRVFFSHAALPQHESFDMRSSMDAAYLAVQSAPRAGAIARLPRKLDGSVRHAVLARFRPAALGTPRHDKGEFARFPCPRLRRACYEMRPEVRNYASRRRHVCSRIGRKGLVAEDKGGGLLLRGSVEQFGSSRAEPSYLRSTCYE